MGASSLLADLQRASALLPGGLAVVGAYITTASSSSSSGEEEDAKALLAAVKRQCEGKPAGIGGASQSIKFDGGGFGVATVGAAGKGGDDDDGSTNVAVSYFTCGGGGGGAGDIARAVEVGELEEGGRSDMSRCDADWCPSHHRPESGRAGRRRRQFGRGERAVQRSVFVLDVKAAVERDSAAAAAAAAVAQRQSHRVLAGAKGGGGSKKGGGKGGKGRGGGGRR